MALSFLQLSLGFSAPKSMKISDLMAFCGCKPIPIHSYFIKLSRIFLWYFFLWASIRYLYGESKTSFFCSFSVSLIREWLSFALICLNFWNKGLLLKVSEVDFTTFALFIRLKLLAVLLGFARYCFFCAPAMTHSLPSQTAVSPSSSQVASDTSLKSTDLLSIMFYEWIGLRYELTLGCGWSRKLLYLFGNLEGRQRKESMCLTHWQRIGWWRWVLHYCRWYTCLGQIHPFGRYIFLLSLKDESHSSYED